MTVIGGVNIDLLVEPAGPLLMGTSNPGRVSMSPGGVARNIAEVLARLGVSSVLIGAFGDDPLSQWVSAKTEETGVEVHRIRKDAITMGTYISVQGDGDMVTAFSDLAATESISPEEVLAALNEVRFPNFIVVDCNITAETMQSVVTWANDRGVPVIVEPVSVAKASRIRDVVGKIACITPNAAEAHALGLEPLGDGWIGSEGRRVDGTTPAASIEHWCVTLGAEGAVYSPGVVGATGIADTTGVADTAKSVTVPAVPVEVRNTNGAGDAFVAGIVWALLQEEVFPPADWTGILRGGVTAAGCAVSSTETTPQSLTPLYLRNPRSPLGRTNE